VSSETEIEQGAADEAKEPASALLVITLGIAGLLAGIVLVGTFIFTKPLIEQNKAEALQRAIFKVLANCDSFEELVLVDGVLKPAGDKTKDGGDVKQVFVGYDKNKEFVGFAIPGAEPGFQDIIGVIYGYNPHEEIIVGFEVLESKETPGLGDKIFKDLAFQENFKALRVSPEIVIVKNGQKANDNEVEAITGATISSKAVVRLLNKSMEEWKKLIEAYVESEKLGKP
tara:strand:+ start:4251 stop:4934 length:684 start_codon:yes stop_codon:yes gene_type:complete